MLSSPRKPSRTMRIFYSAAAWSRDGSLTVSSALFGTCLSRCLIVFVRPERVPREQQISPRALLGRAFQIVFLCSSAKETSERELLRVTIKGSSLRLNAKRKTRSTALPNDAARLYSIFTTVHVRCPCFRQRGTET